MSKKSGDISTDKPSKKELEKQEAAERKARIAAEKKATKERRKARKKEKRDEKRSHATPWDMYTGLAYQALMSNKPVAPDTLGAGMMKVGYNFIHTDECLQAFFYVVSFPESIPLSLLSDIRDAFDFRYVRINFDMWLNPERINWDSTQMKDMRATWEDMVQESAMEEEQLFETQKKAYQRDREKWLVASWNHVAKADRDKKGIIDSNLIIKLRTINNSPEAVDEFLIACKELIRYGETRRIEIKRISGFIIDVLQNSSPLMSNTRTVSRELINSRTLIDEIIANMMTYTPGKLSETEIFMGIDRFTGRLTYMDFNNIRKKSLNILLAGSTGSGKSFYAKCLLRECLARNKNCIILDRDCEYVNFAEAVGGVVLNLGTAGGRYFDSVQIGEPTGYEEIDKGLFMESVNTTTSIFNILVSPKRGMDSTQLKIFNDAYTMTLATAGVDRDNRETWKNSHGLSFKDIYDNIAVLSRNSRYVKIYGNVLRDLVDKLSIYFDSDGIKHELFAHKISINDIIALKKEGRAPMIDICLYLDQDTDQTEQGMMLQQIKYITADYLTILLTNYNKSLEEETIVFVEEYNRYIGDSRMQELIINMITGNRKRNAATILITNNPEEIVIGDAQVTRALANNIKNVIIGKVENRSAIEKICRAWEMEYCIDTIIDISTKQQFSHCFLTKKENGEIAVIKHIMPQELARSKMFSTAD